MDVVPFVGEPLAIDLVNTQMETSAGPQDLLISDEGVRVWLRAESARLGHVDGQVAPKALRTLRTHVADAIQHVRGGEKPTAETLQVLVDAQRAASPFWSLDGTAGALVATRRRDGSITQRLVAELAEDAVRLLASDQPSKIRRCDGPKCRMIFVAKNSRRRWCLPEICGNRVRVARYYQRHKS